MTYERVTVVGGGLAGCECACQLADRDIPVVLHEMRPCVSSPAHRTDGLAELVCSNSLKSTRIDSAAGLLKENSVAWGRCCCRGADALPFPRVVPSLSTVICFPPSSLRRSIRVPLFMWCAARSLRFPKDPV